MPRPRRYVFTPAKPDRSLPEIRAVIDANRTAGRHTFEGLESSEVGAYHRALMFGENDEAFPDQATWSRIVD
jgi:hypothetical protein